MADQKKKKLSPEAQSYQAFQKKRETKRSTMVNCVKAFLIGGAICLFGQVISTFYIYFFSFTDETVGNPTVATLIFITMLLTGFGLYDKIGEFAGAGTAVPVTGFGNSVISSAIEYRTEGFVVGTASNMLKMAGPVIVFGVFSAFVIVIVKTILVQWGGL